MNPKQISQDDLILFAMQDLTPAEAAEVLVHLEHSEAAREELAQIRSDLAMYAVSSELHSPPALARERLLRQVVKERKAAPVERSATDRRAQERNAVSEEPVLVPRAGRIFEDERAPRRSSMGFFGWAGWAVAAGCALTAGLEYRQHQSLQQALYTQSQKLDQVSADAAKAQAVMKMLTDDGAMQVALHQPASGPPEPPKPEGHAAYVAETGQLVFIGLHLAPLDTYKTYELWVIPSGGHDPIPAGIFKPDQRGFATVVLPELQKGIVAKTFAVTIEDDGGTKLPQGAIVLAGV